MSKPMLEKLYEDRDNWKQCTEHLQKQFAVIYEQAEQAEDKIRDITYQKNIYLIGMVFFAYICIIMGCTFL